MERKVFNGMQDKIIARGKKLICWQVLAVLTVGIIVFAGVWFYPDCVVYYIDLAISWFVEDSEVTRNVIYLIAVLVSVVAGYFLFRRTKATEQGLTVERLTRAVEQLASEDSSVRLGGILGLEQIADSHEEERVKIIQILVARIRELAPRNDTKKTIMRYQRLDVETALKTLARIAEPISGFEKFKLCELQRTNLSGFRLGDINLSYFNLKGADISGTIFREANFTKTFMYESNISGTILDNVKSLTQKQINAACWRNDPPFLPLDIEPPTRQFCEIPNSAKNK